MNEIKLALRILQMQVLVTLKGNASAGTFLNNSQPIQPTLIACVMRLERLTDKPKPRYSHSMVAGGLLEMS
jgi:hypothetical protein